MKETQAKRTEIYDGRVIHVVCDDIVLENGETSKREVVLHNGGVCIALQDDDGKYFLVRQYRYAQGKEMLEFCAGKIEKGEEPWPAIVRECEEELGYEAEDLIFLGTVVPTPGYCSEVIYLFHGHKGKRVGQHFDKDEDLTLEKYSIEELGQMIEEGIIDDSKTIVLTYRIERKGLHVR